LPVYEYLCKKGHRYEKAEGFSAPTSQKCTQCGAPAKRQISMPAVIFKGSGFYSTDNRGSKGRKDSSSSADDAVADTIAKSSADNGHGHSHGPGGHSHDSPSAKVDASVD
jgi:putative FmdB family regulatory protein